MRNFPASVRTAYLGSPVPIDAANPLAFAKTGQAALDQLFSACAADAAMPLAHFRNLREEFRAVAGQARFGHGARVDPRARGTALLNRGRVAEWMRSKLYPPQERDDAAVDDSSCLCGRLGSLVKDLLADRAGSRFGFKLGAVFSITCSEDVAFVREQDIAAQTQGTFLGDYRVRQQQAACKEWPTRRCRRLPPTGAIGCADIVRVGRCGRRYAAWYADRVASGFSNRLQVIVKGQGHTEWSDCLAQLVRGWL